MYIIKRFVIFFIINFMLYKIINKVIFSIRGYRDLFLCDRNKFIFYLRLVNVVEIF